MPTLEHAPHKDGDCFVNYENKVFEDVKAQPGEKALSPFIPLPMKVQSGL